jgi:hypothetical protein
LELVFDKAGDPFVVEVEGVFASGESGFVEEAFTVTWDNGAFHHSFSGVLDIYFFQ